MRSTRATQVTGWCLSCLSVVADLVVKRDSGCAHTLRRCQKTRSNRSWQERTRLSAVRYKAKLPDNCAELLGSSEKRLADALQPEVARQLRRAQACAESAFFYLGKAICVVVLVRRVHAQ